MAHGQWQEALEIQKATTKLQEKEAEEKACKTLVKVAASNRNVMGRR